MGCRTGAVCVAACDGEGVGAQAIHMQRQSVRMRGRQLGPCTLYQVIHDA